MRIAESDQPDSRKPLQFSLYSGIALVVISMLFLGKQQSNASFGAQALTVFAAPAFFFFVGAIVYRYLNAPLAGPGIVATGTWLLGVDLIHLYVQRILLPDVIQPYYWLTVSLVGALLITIIGYRVRIWMHDVLVPLVQINAVWSVMVALGLTVEWMLPSSFVLVLIWWQWPHTDAKWRSVYRVAAGTLATFLLVLPVLLQLSTPKTLMATWAAGAATVAFLGIRYGSLKLGPLTIVLLTGATMWGIAPPWWPLAWLVLAVFTIIFIERIESDDPDGTRSTATKLSQMLAVLLAGGAALFAEVGPIFLNITMHPLGIVGTLLGAGMLLAWLGWRRDLRMAAHTGLWLIASGWSNLYFATIPATNTYGLWLALLASAALFAERILTSRRKEKGKAAHTLLNTLTYWPIADLVIGLSTITLIWTALSISTAAPAILIATFAVIIGLWIVAGLLYRLPILLHIALWVAPLPYALILILVAPALWTLPLLGIAWQILGLGLLVFAHITLRYRPTVLLPFFIVGYALLGFGFSIALGNSVFMPLSLTIVVLASIGTSVAVIADRHVAWDYLLSRLLPVDRFPFAHRHIRHAFLLLAGWLTAIWLHLMLGYSGLALPRQGLTLVLCAGVWFAFGHLLTRFPTAVSWPVVTAGWLMWGLGLLEVFFSPREALIAVVVGLIVSAESLRRTREIAWIPIFIVQLLFSAFQIALVLALPGYAVLFIVAICISAAGMLFDTHAPRSGRITTLTGGILALGIGAYHFDSGMLLIVAVLIVVATAHYRRWQGLLATYAVLAAVLAISHIQIVWWVWLTIGLAHIVSGGELLRALRIRRFRTLKTAMFRELDWATPLLWIGTVCLAMSYKTASYGLQSGEIFIAMIAPAIVITLLSLRLNIARLPYIPVLLSSSGLIFVGLSLSNQPYSRVVIALLAYGLLLAIGATLIRLGVYYLLRHNGIYRRLPSLVWWIRPMLAASTGFAGISAVLLVALGGLYSGYAAMKIVTGLCLAMYAVLVYIQTRRLGWLWLALGVTWYTWAIALSQFGINGIVWQTLPIGAALMLMGKRFYPKTLSFDLIGCGVLLWGVVVGLEKSNLMSPQGLVLVVYVIGLATYGYIAGRRIPFSLAMLVVGAGLLYIIAKLNIWFIPLGGGVLLMMGALLVEVRHATVEHWLELWRSRWQLWQ
jgi:hypothetical protein